MIIILTQVMKDFDSLTVIISVQCCRLTLMFEND